MSETRIIGLDELKAKFRQLPVDVGKKVLRKGAGAGAKVIKAAQIAGAPVAAKAHRRGVAPGLLKRAAIIKFVREQSTPEQAVYIVTFRQGKKQQAVKRGRGKNASLVNLDAYYAKFVERGHRIVPRSRRIGTYRGKARYAVSKKQRRAAATGMVAPRWFFANALRTSQAQALQRIVDVMTTETVKALA